MIFKVKGKIKINKLKGKRAESSLVRNTEKTYVPEKLFKTVQIQFQAIQWTDLSERLYGH